MPPKSTNGDSKDVNFFSMYGVSTEWVRTEGGWDDNIGLNRCRIDF